MARTLQRARVAPANPSNDNNDNVNDDQEEINKRITAEDLQRYSKLEKAPMQAQLKHLERRWTKKGRAYITEPQEEDIPEEKINWYEKFALCITRTYDNQNKYILSTALQVNSPHLKELLKKVIGTYPGQSFHTKDIAINFQPQCLYHYRHELAEAGREYEEDSVAAKHLSILLQFIDEQFQDTIAESKNLRDQGLISFEILWTLFRPGTLVYTTTLSQPRVYQLQGYNYSFDQCAQCQVLNLNVSYVDFDGDNFGTMSGVVKVPDFQGAAHITDLNAFPLQHHSHEAAVRKAIIGRGRRWESYAGQNFCEYTGLALGESFRYNIQGRVMIDCKTVHRVDPHKAFKVNAYGRPAEAKRKQALNSKDLQLVPEDDWELVSLTDDQCMLANATVRGFSFTEKQFLDFFVDKLSPVEWNEGAFEQLVLPEAQKETVQALVAEHTSASQTGAFEDIVKGKGRGLILVLHGPPGVGKTLTAECVAEFSHRPLYIVSAGDLGTTSKELDRSLSRILDLASAWKAVLLIDEADVFLERRSLHDMERNALVSIFLRTLEYYSGILFMTTNRVRTFDDAFKSRIHVPLKYEELPQPSRERIWRNFLGKTEGGVNIDAAGYEMLSKGELNGRQIKNVIRTAKSLAAYKKRKLDHKQLQQVMDIQTTFEKELDAAAISGEIDVVER